MKRTLISAATALIGLSALYSPLIAQAYAYAGADGAYAGSSGGYQPLMYQYGGYGNGGYGSNNGYGYGNGYEYGRGNGYDICTLDHSHCNDHNIRNEDLYQLSPSQYWVPMQQNTMYAIGGGPGGYGNNMYYGQQGYQQPYGYGNSYGYDNGYGNGYGSGYGNGYYGGNTGYYGGNNGSGYGPYLPSTPVYDSSYAPYSNYYRAYPQVSHYMTGDTNILGQQLCRWDDYQGANMPCGWDPQQWVYDPWTGSYY